MFGVVLIACACVFGLCWLGGVSVPGAELMACQVLPVGRLCLPLCSATVNAEPTDCCRGNTTSFLLPPSPPLFLFHTHTHTHARARTRMHAPSTPLWFTPSHSPFYLPILPFLFLPPISCPFYSSNLILLCQTDTHTHTHTRTHSKSHKSI